MPDRFAAIGAGIQRRPLRSPVAPAEFAALAVAFAVCLAVFYPGMMSIDSYEQLRQARIDWYNNFHPPLMSRIWHFLDRLILGPFGMLLLQLSLLLGGLLLVVRGLGLTSPRVRIVVFLSVLLLPPVFSIVGNIWKDVWMAAFLLLATGLAMRLPHVGSGRDALVAGALACLLAATLMRHNGVVPAAPIVLYLVWLRLDRLPVWRRMLASGLVAPLLVVALFFLAMGINSRLADVRMPVSQSMPLHDLVGIAVGTGDITLVEEGIPADSSVRRAAGFTLEDLARDYTPRTWTTLVFEEGSLFRLAKNKADEARLWKAWRRAVRTYPAVYVRHRWAVFREVIGWSDEDLFAPVYFGVPKESPDYQWVKTDYNTLSPFQQQAEAWLDEHSERWYFRPVVWMLVGALLLVASLAGRERSDWIVVLLMSGLANQGVLFFIAPSADYRYSHWTILVAVLATVHAVARVALRLARRAGASEIPFEPAAEAVVARGS